MQKPARSSMHAVQNPAVNITGNYRVTEEMLGPAGRYAPACWSRHLPVSGQHENALQDQPASLLSASGFTHCLCWVARKLRSRPTILI